MPTVADRLCQVTLKVKRAKEHIADLDGQIKAFLDTKPYRVVCKVDAQTRKPVYYVDGVEPTPKSLPLIAGDAIQNLMSALDHLAYQLVCSDTGDKPPNVRGIYFPIADDAAKYEAIKGRKIEGACKETVDAIDALKPYKGGNDLLWMLYRLNNIEKHRLLLTVGSRAAGVNFANVAAREIRDAFPDKPEIAEAFGKMAAFLLPADKGFPLKPGFELYIGGPDEKPDPKQEFRFDVALGESGIIEGESLLGTLHQISTEVEGVITALTPRLRDTT